MGDLEQAIKQLKLEQKADLARLNRERATAENSLKVNLLCQIRLFIHYRFRIACSHYGFV